MSKETIRFVREEGKKVYENLKKEFYLNHSGLKDKTNITEILKQFRDISEPEVFQSLRDCNPKTEDESNGIKLMLSFLAQIILLSKSPQIEDSIMDLEASSVFSTGKTKIPFRKSRTALLKNQRNKTQKILREKERLFYLSSINSI